MRPVEDIAVQFGVSSRNIEIMQIQNSYEFGRNSEGVYLAKKWIHAYSDAESNEKIKVNNYLSLMALRRGDHALAIDSARAAVNAATEMHGPSSLVARYLRGLEFIAQEAPPELRGDSARVAATTSAKGKTQIAVEIQGRSLRALVDTGAERSLISRDLAVELGFQLFPNAKIPMRYAFDDEREVELAIAPAINIGSMEIKGDVFLVVDMATSPVRSSNFVLGLSTLERVGQIGIIRRGKEIVIGPKNFDFECFNETGQMFWHSDGLGLSAEIGGVTVPSHYDTGFPTTYAYSTPIRFYVPGKRASKLDSYRQSPVGRNADERIVAIFRSLTLVLGGEDIRERNVPIFSSLDASHALGIPLTLGGTITKKFELIVLDFNRMQYAAVKRWGEDSNDCLTE